MSSRLFLGLVIVACIWASVICTDEITEASSAASSKTSSRASGSTASSTSFTQSRRRPRPKGRPRKIKKCPKNEEFSCCPESIGRAQYCTEKGEPYSYPRTDAKCNAGCVCKENYLRADNGTCIPEKQCDITCGPNETLDNCPAECDSDYCPTSAEDDSDCLQPSEGNCPPPACKCIFNHRRALNGSCIPTVDCPPFDCSARPNEEYNSCPPFCPSDDCSQASPTGKCPLFGVIGIVLECNPKCRCIKGYWRLNGTCVPYEECLKKCSNNEEFSYCPESIGRAQYCNEKGEPYSYPRTDAKCNARCVCKENYLRADNGTCIPEEQCEITCGPNEILDNCPAECNSDYCPTSAEDDSDCLQPSEGDCPPPACKCIFNHRRALNGSCIPTVDCPPFDCSARPNEEYNSCPPFCPSNDCSQASPTGKCPLPGRIGIVLECNPKCRCIKGYWRQNGTCVPYEECLKKCPNNEEFSYCPESLGRAQYCNEKGEPYSYPRTDAKCNAECVCKENYLRADNGTCIPEEQCEITCGPNEILDNCPAECNSDYCPTSAEDDSDCLQPSEGDCPPPACKCIFNHRRALNGSCIPTVDCPPFDCSARPNEEYNSCPPFCPSDDCSQASPTGKCPLPGRIGIVLECNPKCRCIKGYWRLNGICVPYEECPGVCPKHERYSTCIQAECRPLDCTQKDEPVPCVRIDPKYCIEGCVCVEKYLRNADGKCVPENKCEKNECPTNEEYAQCIQGVCRAMNCSQRGQDVPCPEYPPEECDPGCICKEFYLRDDNGNCIPEEQCEPVVCPPNEEWSTCAQATCRAQECSERGQPIACPLIAEGYCIKACVCKPNYLRNEAGECVPEDQCPPIKCPPNEEFSQCVQNICRPQYCSEAGGPLQPFYCAAIADEYCSSGCVCQLNYLRNDNGDCVPIEKCENNICPPNEEWNYCAQATCRPESCAQRGFPIPCPAVAFDFCQGRCMCKQGYLRNEAGECIPEDQCPPKINICPPNEEWFYCIQGACKPESCTQRGFPILCPDVAIEFCQGGCMCKQDYLRNEAGKCIPEDQCPPNQCPSNEQWTECIEGSCTPQYCSEKGGPISCPAITPEGCSPGCICLPNYLRNDYGYCIPEDQCPPQTCGINEEYTPCIQGTCRYQNCEHRDEPPACDFTTSDGCIPGCICQENYYRNENGICVSYEECGAQTCGINEEYTPCIQGTCRYQNCEDRDEPPACDFTTSDGCIPGCICQENYYRNENGVCVSYEECGAQTCGLNEEYTPCIQGICRYQSCEDRDEPPACDFASSDGCTPGCICQENYYRNEKGICVSYEECGGPLCPRPNEVFTKTKKACPPNICESLVTKYACDPDQIEEPGCVCADGYLRLNENSKCIPICDCPQMANSPDCP